MQERPSLAWRVAASVLTLTLSWSGCVSAREEPAGTKDSTEKSRSSALPAPESYDEFAGDAPHRLEWRYPRFSEAQLGLSLTQSAAGLALELGLPLADSGWRRGILFDDQARKLLVARSHAGRTRAAHLSDMAWYSTMAFSVFDSALTPLLGDSGNTDVALQLTLIDWQAFGFAFLLTRIPHKALGRGRPSLEGCKHDPHYEPACNPANPGRTASAFSGHSSMSFTAASLVCMHHIHLELYGDPALDYGICGLALASAGTVGALRIVADKHWTSDVLVGTGVGLLSGLGVPYLFHYSQPAEADADLDPAPVQVAVAPVLDRDSVGVGARGFF
ncbi:MAG: phosphatase PAP2 family protein [Polyangiaceae bacterium]